MLEQVLSSVFDLMAEYSNVWPDKTGSYTIPRFGFTFDVGLEPIPVDTTRMFRQFQRGARELGELWEMALQPSTLSQTRKLARTKRIDQRFHLEDELWVKVVYEFSAAHHKHGISRSQLLRSLTPLYLARVASFINEVETMSADEVEYRIERLCMTFERLKTYLISLWFDKPDLPAMEAPCLKH
jgi:hypothetical protein